MREVKPRDLKKDLRIFEQNPCYSYTHGQSIEIAERLIKAEAKLTKIQRILREPAPFGAISEQLDQIREVVADE